WWPASARNSASWPAASRTGATDRMRLLFVTHNYPRHAGDVAGSFLHPVARELVQRGVDLQVIAPSDRGDSGDPMLDEVPARRVRYAVSSRETIAYTGRMSDALRSVSG